MIQQQLPQEQQQQSQEENANCMRSVSNPHQHQTLLGQSFTNLIQFYCSTTQQIPPHFALGQNLIQRSASLMSPSNEVPVSQQLQQFQQQKLRRQQVQQQQLQNIGSSSISMQFSSSMINQGYMAQETSPSQQTSDHRIMWQGILEWSDNGKSSNPNGPMNHIPCYITLNRKEGNSDLNMETWPQKLLMLLLPKQLICNIGVQCIENSNYITFHAKTGGTVDDFTKLISSNVIGFVQIRNVSNETKVMILLFNINRRACIGFIPNDQISFVRQLRKQIYIKKSQTIQQLQRQIQESQRCQKTQSMLSPHMSTLFPSTITFQESRNHAIELLPVLWKGLLEWTDQSRSSTVNNVTRHIFCGVALRTNERDTTKLKIASWPRKMKMYLLPKRPFINIASRFHANSIFALLHLIPGESLDILTEMLKSDFVGCIDVNNSNSLFTETKTLVILPTSNKGLCVGFFSNDHSDLIGELRMQSLFRKVSAVNQKLIQNHNTIASHGGTLPFTLSNQTEHRTEVILPTQRLGSTMEGYLGCQGRIASNGSVMRPFESQSANVNQNSRQEASSIRSSSAEFDSQATITSSTSAISDTPSGRRFDVNVYYRNQTSDADLNSEDNNSSNKAKRMRLSNIPEVKNSVNERDENYNYENSSSCSVCMENAVDTVIYTCGHMCLCFFCAQKLLKRTDDNRRCPICRSLMRDVIKVYRS